MKSIREIRQAAEYAGVRVALAMAASLPLGMARAVGASIGSLAFALGVRRRISVDNVAASLGVSRGAATGIARRSYQNLGRSMMEFSALKHWSRDELLRQVSVEGRENLEAARAAGRGAVIISGHLGCWEFATAVVPALGYPTNLLVGEQTNARVDDVMNEVRRVHGGTIITKQSALKKVLTSLRNNEFVVFLADQDARKGGVMVDFLGRRASVVRGPAMFALRANAPIIVFSVHRDGRRHRIVFEPPIWPNPDLEEEASVLDLTRRHTDALARRIREHPDEYFWPHRRWKTGASQVANSQPVDTRTE